MALLLFSSGNRIFPLRKENAVDQFLRKLGIEFPIVQAPMAGVSTPELAAAVSNAGALGSIGVGAADAEATRQMIAAVRARTERPFQVNVFCHKPAVADAAREAAWLARLAPEFARYGAKPPARLTEIYQSFLTDDAKLAVLLAARPLIVSFHFGLPARERIEALRAAGIVLLATATNLEEGKAIAAAGIDSIVAQGYEAGGHRGVFDPDAADEQLGTIALSQLLVRKLDIPVIAAGGIMDGAGIAAALTLGAVAAQLGTAFVACPESSADAGYRAALLGPPAKHTVMTRMISGRSARCLANRITALAEGVDRRAIPDYPIAYDAGKALHAAAKAKGEFGYGAQWAGQGAPLARALPARELVTRLRREMEEALADAGKLGQLQSAAPARGLG
jgi:nitronate monooxygenase